MTDTQACDSNGQMTSFPKNKIKVVLFENVHKAGVKLLEDAGYSVETIAGALSGDELKEKVRDARVLGVRSKTKLTKEVLAEAQKLMCIGCFCIGTDQTDLPFAEERAVPVFNSPFSNSRSVAELIISCVISLARKLSDKSADIHAGKWMKTATGCYEIRGKTLGIVGYGHIGSQLSVLSEALGMRVIYKDRKNIMPLGNARQLDTLDELLSESDFVTLHVPDTEETRYMIKAEQLAKMKKGSYLLNASRGKVVDLDAMAESLKSGHLAGGMVDVYPKEPAKNGDLEAQGVTIPLRGLNNVILTPHIGGSTEEAQEAIGVEVATKLINFIDRGDSDGAVNFPNVTPPQAKEGTHRLLHVHHNVPGVLRKIFSSIAEGNVSYQTVQTTDKIGYFVADISSELSEDVLGKLQAIEETIKVRILY